MKPEDATPAPPAQDDAFRDGLAGREGASADADADADAREGARLREALLPQQNELAATPVPPWQTILASARPEPAALPTNRPAANEGRWRRAAVGAVAALAVASGLWIQHTRDEPGPAGWRGGSGSTPNALWRTADPADAAAKLAQRLEAVGASVSLAPLGAGVQLQIACQPSTCAGVNAELIGLEAAVDAEGRLVLQVMPPN